MELTKQGTITLLKSAITGETYPLPEGFDLDTAYPKLKRHNMDALIYEGAVRCGISVQTPVMNRLFQRCCHHLLASEGQLRQVERIFAAFEENGIDYMPLKGCRMKLLYPKPELRYMGDADILIRMEQYPSIIPVMQSLGFTEEAESDHELHWKHPELNLELHKRLVSTYNKDFYRYYNMGWQKASGHVGHCWTMTPEDEWIFLFTHFAKHFRVGGIGCRYVADLWVYLRNNLDMDESYIRVELEKLHLTEFHENIRKVIAVWFEDAEADEKTEFITDYVFSSGSWGNMDDRFLGASARASKTMTGAEGRLVYLWQRVFPDVKSLQGEYWILRRAPWLLPAVWVYRVFYKLLFDREKIRETREKMDKLTTEKLSAHEKKLDYVGLKIQFK